MSTYIPGESSAYVLYLTTVFFKKLVASKQRFHICECQQKSGIYDMQWSASRLYLLIFDVVLPPHQSSYHPQLYIQIYICYVYISSIYQVALVCVPWQRFHPQQKTEICSVGYEFVSHMIYIWKKIKLQWLCVVIFSRYMIYHNIIHMLKQQLMVKRQTECVKVDIFVVVSQRKNIYP